MPTANIFVASELIIRSDYKIYDIVRCKKLQPQLMMNSCMAAAKQMALFSNYVMFYNVLVSCKNLQEFLKHFENIFFVSKKHFQGSSACYGRLALMTAL